MKEENIYNTSGMTHISQFFDNTADVREVRINDSTSATEEIEMVNELKVNSKNGLLKPFQINK